MQFSLVSNKKLIVNSAANFLGQAGGAIINVLTIPFYVQLLGAESFGIVAFIVSLQASLAIFDLGLATAVNREIARDNEANPIIVGNTLSTLARVYWLTSLTLFFALSAATPWIVANWLQLNKLDPESARNCFFLAAASIALRWPVSLYSGAIKGTQKQVLANLISGGMSLVRGTGGLAALLIFGPRLEVFFCWQALSSGVELLLTRYFAWKCLPTGSYSLGRFDRAVLSRIWRFAAGFGFVAALGTLVANLDRLLLARLLPLENLGFLAMLGTAAGIITLCGSAVSAASFPRFVKAVEALDSRKQLGIELKDSLCLIMPVIVPCLLVFIFFTASLLAVWTGKSQLPIDGSVILRLFALGAAVNAVGNPFYMIVVAHGSLRWLWGANLLSFVILLPLYWFGIPVVGITLAAVGWCLLNIILISSCILCCRKIVEMPRLSYAEIGYLVVTIFLFALASALAEHYKVGDWASLGLSVILSAFSVLGVERVRHAILKRFKKV